MAPWASKSTRSGKGGDSIGLCRPMQSRTRASFPPLALAQGFIKEDTGTDRDIETVDLTVHG